MHSVKHFTAVGLRGDTKGGRRRIVRASRPWNMHMAQGPSGVGRAMPVHILKSKIHRARVTGANVQYEGSMTIDEDFMDKVGLVPFEKILCSNMANAARFETYAIPGMRGSKQIVLNGAAAHLGKSGDRLTIMSFTEFDLKEAKMWKPRVIILDEQNNIVNERGI